MVDVSAKSVTARSATARTVILLPSIIAALFDPHKNEFQQTPKGPVIATAIIAGTQAVKLTSNLIPFCHPLPIEHIKFNAKFVQDYHRSEADQQPPVASSPSSYSVTSSPTSTPSSAALVVDCTVRCTARTGVEMEALTGVSVAALTIYDMLKALSHDMMILNTKLIQKSGGKSGTYQAS